MNPDQGVSICIIAHNEETQITRCLNSLVQPQNPNSPFEILVIDNASKDATGFLVEKFAVQSPEIRVRLIRLKQNSLGAARAEALQKAQYSLVAFTDADCLTPPGWVDGLKHAFLSCFQTDSTTVAVGGGNVSPSNGSSSFHWALNVMLSSGLGGFGTLQARPETQKMRVAHLPTCNVLYDRAAVLVAGNFSTFFDRVCEDMELSHRLAKNGKSLYFIPELDVLHFHKQSLLAWSEKMFRYGWGQINVARLHPFHLRGVKGLPLLAIALAMARFLKHPSNLIIATALYGATVTLYAFTRLVRAQAPLSLVFQLVLLFFSTHLFYALGEAWGILQLCTQTLKKPWKKLFRPASLPNEG